MDSSGAIDVSGSTSRVVVKSGSASAAADPKRKLNAKPATPRFDVVCAWQRMSEDCFRLTTSSTHCQIYSRHLAVVIVQR